MIWRDGNYNIYKIQHLQSDGEWVGSSFDAFGTPKGFNASGDCWQTTGVHGTFDKDEAIDGAFWLTRKHLNTKFRVILVEISQKTTIIYQP